MPQHKLIPPPWINNPEQWKRRSESNKRYGYEQWMLARVRRGHHPIPGSDKVETSVDQVDSPAEGGSTSARQKTAPKRTPVPDLAQGPPPKVQVVPSIPEQSANNDKPQPSTSNNHPVSNMASSSHAAGGMETGSARFAQMNLPASRSSTSGSYNNNPGGSVSSQNNSHQNGGHAFFTKTHRFFTYGFNDNLFTVESDSNIMGEKSKIQLLTSNLAGIPWDRVAFYLTPAEFNTLPNGSKITKCGIKVRFTNISQCFDTNSTESRLAALAALHQANTIMTAVGLNISADGCDHKYNSITPSTGEPNSISVWTKSNWAEQVIEFYGEPDNENPPSTRIPRSLIGSPVNLNKYFVFIRQVGDPNFGWPDMSQGIKFFDATQVLGKHVIELDFVPSMGYIKAPYRAHMFSMCKDATQSTVSGGSEKTAYEIALPTLTLNREVGCTKIKVDKHTWTFYEHQFTKEDNQTIDKYLSTESNFGYDALIEKCQMMVNPQKTTQVVAQPSVHVGVKPAMAISMSEAFGQERKKSDLQAEWEVQAYCEVTYNFPIVYHQATVPHNH